MSDEKNGSNSQGEELFWADQIAQRVINREKFKYTDDSVPKLDRFTVKTSASLSGVLHIGRLSDTIRGESVALALKDAGVKTRFIWVAEDMDPLRKIPKGLPKEYEKYLGMPVTDVPDPSGEHESYAKKHVTDYFKVIDEFVTTPLEKFSMREEYKKGSFNTYIKNILKHVETVVDIQNKYRKNKLSKDWCPWTPICEKCGKIATPVVTEISDGKVYYECKDYHFESATAKGCGHIGVNDPLKGNGKLMWKSEWASQWAYWQVVSEGAGKEYQVPNSAWWINAEIVEHVHKFPMPEPIFYEHIMIDNVKMSASLGNVVYPADWLEVADPQHLRLFYNKRLMKTRSFSWKNLPMLYDEYDKMCGIYVGDIEVENDKEKAHFNRLLDLSTMGDVKKPLPMAFSHASVITQMFVDEEGYIGSLQRTGHYDEENHDRIMHRLAKARVWVDKYAPEESKFTLQTEVGSDLELSDKQRESLGRAVDVIEAKEYTDEELQSALFAMTKEIEIPAKDFFKAAYNVLFRKDRGPKLGGFINAIGKEKVVSLFKQVT